jgi:subtilisin family serine protease
MGSAAMSKLDPYLEQALAVWRVQSSAESPDVARAAERRARRVTVIVTYEGELAALQAAGLDTGYDQGGRVSGQIALADVERLAAVPSIIEIALEPTVRPLLDGSVTEMQVPWKIPGSPSFQGKGAGVIVAVIDTGIDIFHESFRKSNGDTRIIELWDQAATTGGGGPPTGFQQIGRVFTGPQINAGIAAGPPFASVDTDGHGTHVAGTAAGNGRQDDRCSSPGTFVGVAPEADIIAVRAIALPAGATSNSTDALQWCAQAGARHSNKAVVINCSFGRDLGPHDGTGALDVVVDGILRPAAGIPPGLAIVCSAGNEGDREIHEGGTIAGGTSTTLSFYVHTGVTTPMMDIWYNGTATLTATLTAPNNPSRAGTNTTGVVSPAAASQSFPIGGMTVAVISNTAPRPANNNKKLINFSISTPSGVSARNGVWTLTLAATGGTAANWDAWITASSGYVSFRLPSATGPAPANRRNNTVGQPGASKNAITVASYSDGNGEIASSSSRGIDPIPAGTPVGEVKPTVAAVGVAVAAPRSRDNPDKNSSCCNQLVIDLSGTSMASPHVAGLVALMFEKNKTLNFEQVRAHLQHSTRIDGIPTGEVPPVYDTTMNIRANHIWGSGKVNAAVALAEIPAASSGGGGGGGGGGGPTITLDGNAWGYTPHTIYSRLGEWRRRFGPRPGLMLAAALISEHVDEILRLINQNARVGAVWRRQGGPYLVRHLLRGIPPQQSLLPATVDGCDVGTLIQRFVPILDRFSGTKLKTDIARYRDFVQKWPGTDLQRLDAEALRLAGQP